MLTVPSATDAQRCWQYEEKREFSQSTQDKTYFLAYCLYILSLAFPIQPWKIAHLDYEQLIGGLAPLSVEGTDFTRTLTERWRSEGKKLQQSWIMQKVAISKYTVLLTGTKKGASVERFETSEITHCLLLNYECYFSRQVRIDVKAARKFNGSSISSSEPVDGYVSASNSRVQQPQNSRNEEEIWVKDHSRLVFFLPTPLLKSHARADVGVWWARPPYISFCFMLLTGHASTSTHGRTFPSTQLEFLTRTWLAHWQEGCQTLRLPNLWKPQAQR